MRCLFPYQKLDESSGQIFYIPCGKCYRCIMRRVNGWAFRLDQEFKKAQSADFITFTYDSSRVPIASNGELVLRKPDLQKFFKRLRKHHQGAPIKYFACGEYGTQTKRPHYHALIFNAKLLDIEKHWIDGAIHRGDVNPATTYYTLKYMCKGLPKQWWKKRGLEPEFQVMSKGLGLGYLTPSMEEWHAGDLFNRYYLPIHSGIKVPMPRYYRNKLYTPESREELAYYFFCQNQLDEKEQLPEEQAFDLRLREDMRLKRTKFNQDKL